MCTVSIIIPVYNSEKYLRECLDSVWAQTYTDFEVLLINDGSTDESGKICDEYTAKDQRFKVFHKVNGGVSSARNLGIEIAKGEWITFVDSDDTIAANFLSSFLLDHSKAEFHIQGIHKDYGEKKIDLKFEDGFLDVSSFLAKYYFSDYFFGPTSKLYRKEILMKQNISFDTNSSYGEDVIFNLTYFLFCSKIKTCTNVGYYYRLTDGNGLSNAKEDFEVDFKLLSDIKARFKDLNQKHSLKKDYKYHVEYLIGRMLRSVYLPKKNKQSLTRLKRVFSCFKEELLFVYRKSRFAGKLCVFLIKTNQITVLDKLNKKYFFR